MQVHYLEIVTSDVDAVCQTYSPLHGVTFNDADPNLGGARTATLAGGGVLGVRSPMHGAENPVVRPYVLVDEIQATVDAAWDFPIWSECDAAMYAPPEPGSAHSKLSFRELNSGGRSAEEEFWKLRGHGASA